MSKLPDDCLGDIFEYLVDDKFTLHSCLLVNHLWCRVAVRILWRVIWNYNDKNISTLIACLPNESKEILLNNGIIISTPTSKPPMFNYASFCKVLSMEQIKKLLQQWFLAQNLNYNNIIIVDIVEQEILKSL